jgi:hypothetical protein
MIKIITHFKTLFLKRKYKVIEIESYRNLVFMKDYSQKDIDKQLICIKRELFNKIIDYIIWEERKDPQYDEKKISAKIYLAIKK